MASLEEALVGEFNITVAEPVVGEFNITVAEPVVGEPNIEAQAPPQLPVASANDPKAVLKEGLFISLISIGEFLYPPITATVNKSRGLLSQIFYFIVFVSLAVGVLLILLSNILHRMPRSIIIANALTKIGRALVTITLGYGSSLVLMVSSFPWFALYVIFLSIQFM